MATFGRSLQEKRVLGEKRVAEAAGGARKRRRINLRFADLVQVERTPDEIDAYASQVVELTDEIICALLVGVAREGKAQCSMCIEKFSCLSPSAPEAISFHMQGCHAIVWEAAVAAKMAINRNGAPAGMTLLGELAARLSAAIASQKLRDQQRTLQPPLSNDHGKTERTVAAVVAFLSAGIPLTHVGRGYLQPYLQTFTRCKCGRWASCDRCSVHSQDWIRRHLDCMVAAVMPILQKEVAGVTSMAVTGLVRTNKTFGRYLVVMGHYSVHFLHGRTIMLGMKRLTSANVTAAVEKIVAEFRKNYAGDRIDLIASVTVANEEAGGSELAAVGEGKGEEDSCFGRTVQLCVRDVEENVPEVAAAISTVTALLQKLTMRDVMLELDIYEDQVAFKSLYRIGVTTTKEDRLSSSFSAVARFLALYPTVEKAIEMGFLQEHGGRDVWILPEEQVELLRRYASLMRPLAEVTLAAEMRGFVSIALVPRWIHEMLEVAETVPAGETEAQRRMREELKHSIERRLASYMQACASEDGPPVVSPALRAAALTPGHWDLSYLPEAKQRLVVDSIIEDCKSFCEPPYSSEDFLRASWGVFEKIKAEFSALPEVRRHCLFPPVDDFWCERPENHTLPEPPISSLAAALLAIPLTSPACTRTFLSDSDRQLGIFSDPDIFCQIAMLKHNLPMLSMLQKEIVSTIVNFLVQG